MLIRRFLQSGEWKSTSLTTQIGLKLVVWRGVDNKSNGGTHRETKSRENVELRTAREVTLPVYPERLQSNAMKWTTSPQTGPLPTIMWGAIYLME